MKPDRSDSGSPLRPGTPISNLRVERYLLGEMDGEERNLFERDASADPLLAASLLRARETSSPLEWDRLRRRLPLPTAAAGTATRSDAIARWIKARFIAPSRSALAWGGALAALLLLIPILDLRAIRPGEDGMRAKGGARPEILLEIQGEKLAPGQRRAVQSGDIIGFFYRSSKPLYTQIWYVEDLGSPALFDGRPDSSLFWPATSAWISAPQRIRLEGEWKSQKVMILASREILRAQDAQRILRGREKAAGGAELFTYDLYQP